MRSLSAEQGVRILLVEDNPIDVKATLRAAKQLRIANTIDVVSDGDAAIEYLTEAGGQNTKPDLILLDLNLPGKDGRDVLSVMKQDPVLKRIPVVILTTSADETDVLAAYDLGANAYVTKPVGLEGWIHVVTQLEGFWFNVVRLPPE